MILFLAAVKLWIFSDNVLFSEIIGAIKAFV